MPKINLALNENKELDGISQRDKRAWAKFQFRIANLGEDSIAFEWHEVRSGPFHRRFFAMLNALYDSQEAFKDFDMFRKWLEVGAAFCDFIPSADGEMIALPKSISYDKLDQGEFQEVSDKIFVFARSSHAHRYLWGHLSEIESGNMVENLLAEFEVDRI
jgi:hypothetical protein